MTGSQAEAGSKLEPWRGDIDAVAMSLGTRLDAGLSSAEAAERFAEVGPNGPGTTESKVMDRPDRDGS